MRSRNIKPGFFKNELLGTCNPITSMLFAGLWLLADREGRLEDRPLRIKAEIFPYRESLDINGSLTELVQMGFICRYETSGCAVIQILNFKKHQTPHKTERLSDLPVPSDNTMINITTCSSPVKPTDNNVTLTEALPPDSLIPDSPIPDSPSGAREVSDFQKVYDSGSQAFPNLATAKVEIIHQWLNAGCSVELDILPEIERQKKIASDVRSWKFFTGAVMDSKATRETPLPTGKPRIWQQISKPVEKPRKLTAEEHERQMRWYREKGLFHRIYNPEIIKENPQNNGNRL